MKRLIKWFTILAFVVLLATAFSYAGMRLRVGQLIGHANVAFVQRQITFGRDSIPGVGRPLAWKVTWAEVRMPGTSRATVWVSPTGKILAVRPVNLDARIDAWQRSREP